MACIHTASFQVHGQHPSSLFVGEIDDGIGTSSLHSALVGDSGVSYGPGLLKKFLICMLHP